MKMIKFLPVLFFAMTLVSCANNCRKDKCPETNCSKLNCIQDSKTADMKAPFAKKYTNNDFYTDGKFNQDVAMQAFKEMFEYYGVPFTETMEKDMWVTDFGMGDFENAGMGGIFWVNNAEQKYFGHEIYLLPNQMIPEHKHVETEYPAKFEAWMVRHGSAYNFSEVGEATPNTPALPASQKASILSKNFVAQGVGPVIELKEIGTYHFLLAGDEGAIITEFATYHDGSGLKFSNPNAKM